MMNDLVQIVNNQAVTSSRRIAEKFGKNHKDVLRSIREILVAQNCATKFYSETTFEYRGQKFPMYLMNRDGFSLLVMGFSGKDAIEWKIKYINAFNEMENRLKGDPMKQLDIMEKQIAIMRQYGQQLVEHSGQIISLNNAMNEVKNTIKGIKELEDLNSTNWRLKSRLVINRIAANYPALDDTNVYSAVRCEFYCRLEAEARCNLGRRLTNRKMRAKAAGASKSDLDKMNRMMIIDEDVRLINCAIAVLKKMAIEYGAID